MWQERNIVVESDSYMGLRSGNSWESLIQGTAYVILPRAFRMQRDLYSKTLWVKALYIEM